MSWLWVFYKCVHCDGIKGAIPLKSWINLPQCVSQPPPAKKSTCVQWDNLKLGRWVLWTLSTQGWRLAPGHLTEYSQPGVLLCQLQVTTSVGVGDG